MSFPTRQGLILLLVLATQPSRAEEPSVSAKGIVYTKIANNGTVLSDSATLGPNPGDWACTRHNATGLIFEVKVADAMTLRNGQNTYTWLSNNAASNGGVGGTSNGGACSGSACDTQAYVLAVNSTFLCGSNLWRLPSRRELRLIVGTAPTGTGTTVADAGFFPNMTTGAYWTGTNLAANADAAWVTELDDGRASWRLKSAPQRIVVVR